MFKLILKLLWNKNSFDRQKERKGFSIMDMVSEYVDKIN